MSEDQTIDLGQTITLQGINEVPSIPINWYNDESGELLCSDCPRSSDSTSKCRYLLLPGIVDKLLGMWRRFCSHCDRDRSLRLEKIIAANAFTPNYDGFNDYFEIRNDGVSTVGLVQVFNRWGEIVFETQNIEVQWDGTFRGEPVNPGVFMYIIHADCVNGNTYQLAGNVTLIR